MRLPLQCIALFMAALWLPATQHCALDALGIIEAHVTHEDHDTGCATHSEETQHAHDTCDIVESSSWLNTAPHIYAPSPKISRHILGSAGHQPGSPLAIPPALRPFIPPIFSPPPPETRDHPQNWLPSRHFAERAAPVSRAPSPTLA